MAIKGFSLRIDEELLDKLHVIADYDGRSANSEILILIKNEIRKFEEQNGKIELGGKNYGKGRKDK